MIQISDECDMYLVRSKEHKQQVQDLEDFERKPLIVDELASTITLQIDKLTLIERIRQYYCQEINRDVIIVACERFGSDNGEIHFRLEQIKVLNLKQGVVFSLYFMLKMETSINFSPFLLKLLLSSQPEVVIVLIWQKMLQGIWFLYQIFKLLQLRS